MREFPDEWDGALLNVYRADLQPGGKREGLSGRALIAAAKDAAERGGVCLLVTTGDDDSVVAVGASERVAELLGEDVPFELLEQTGHLPMDERPDELAALLLRFIADEL